MNATWNQPLHLLITLLCFVSSISSFSSSAAAPSEPTFNQETFAAFRARAITAGRARNEKVVADNYFEAGKLEQSAKLYLHALAVAPDAFSYEEKKQVATRLAKANHQPDAILIFQALLAEKKNDLPAKLEIVKLLTALQQHSIAIAEVDAILKQDRRNKYALLIKADALRKGKKFGESIPLYQRILQQQGNDFDARLGLIYSLLAVGAKSTAKEQFKLLKTEDETQQEQLAELANVIEVNTRSSLNLVRNHYSDSDKNSSVEHGAIFKMLAGNYNLVAEVRDKTASATSYEDTTDTIENTTATAKTYSLSAATNINDQYRVTGKLGRAELTGKHRTLLSTGQIKVDVKTGATTLSGNLSWDALSATTLAIDSAVRVTKKSVEIMHPLTERLKTNLAYTYQSYSDGNAANDVRASAHYMVYRGVAWIGLGYGYHRLDYENPVDAKARFSYATPQNLVAHQAMLTVYYESGKLYLDVDIQFGRESYKKNNSPISDEFRYDVASIGYKLTRKLSLELNATQSNAALADTAGTFDDKIFGASLSYVF